MSRRAESRRGRLVGYYRQFEDVDEEELNRDLRRRRERERAEEMAELPQVDLSATAWPELPHPEIVAAAVFAARSGINNYPDQRGGRVVAALAERHGLAPEQVVLGNGAAELLQAAALALLGPGTELVTPWPSYPLYPRMAERAGAQAVRVALSGEAIDLDAVRAAVTERTRVVVLCNPNDPTGTLVPATDIAALLGDLPEPVHLLLDEAYAEFRDDEDRDAALALAEHHPRLLAVRTFSKVHGLAGLRAGYAVGAPGAPLLDAVTPALGVNAPTQAAVGQALLVGEATAQRRRQLVAEQRARVADALGDLPFHAPPSHANFVWLSGAGMSGDEITARLARSHVTVAPGSQFGDEAHVRATLRGPEATDRLLDALRAASG